MGAIMIVKFIKNLCDFLLFFMASVFIIMAGLGIADYIKFCLDFFLDTGVLWKIFTSSISLTVPFALSFYIKTQELARYKSTLIAIAGAAFILSVIQMIVVKPFFVSTLYQWLIVMILFAIAFYKWPKN